MLLYISILLLFVFSKDDFDFEVVFSRNPNLDF